MSPFPTNEQQDTEPLSAQWQHLHDAYAELTQEKTIEVLEAYLEQYVSLKEACGAHALALDDTQLSVLLMKDLRALKVVIFMTPTAEKKVRQLAGLYHTVLAQFSLSPEDRAYLIEEMRSCAKALILVKKAFFRGPLLHHSDETFEAIAHWEKASADFRKTNKHSLDEALVCLTHYRCLKKKLQEVELFYDDPYFQRFLIHYLNGALKRYTVHSFLVLFRVPKPKDFQEINELKQLFEMSAQTLLLSPTQKQSCLKFATFFREAKDELELQYDVTVKALARLKKMFRLKRD